jgi:hypothetical protein
MLARGVVVTASPLEGRRCHIHALLRREERFRVRRTGPGGRVMQAVDVHGGALRTRTRHGADRNRNLSLHEHIARHSFPTARIFPGLTVHVSGGRAPEAAGTGEVCASWKPMPDAKTVRIATAM